MTVDCCENHGFCSLGSGTAGISSAPLLLFPPFHFFVFFFFNAHDASWLMLMIWKTFCLLWYILVASMYKPGIYLLRIEIELVDLNHLNLESLETTLESAVAPVLRSVITDTIWHMQKARPYEECQWYSRQPADAVRPTPHKISYSASTMYWMSSGGVSIHRRSGYSPSEYSALVLSHLYSDIDLVSLLSGFYIQ